MVEEKSSVENGAPNGDMPPQEVSQKSPLTDGTPPQIEAAKVDSTEVEIGPDNEEEFRGLTKDELLKYAKDPFWVRLRYFMLFLFWAGWVAMLVIAILIIVQAPQCEPPPSLQWLQKSPLIQLDINTFDISNITDFMASLSITSLFLPLLISNGDYYQPNHRRVPTIVNEKIRSVCKTLMEDKSACVTDYVPTPVAANHPWVDTGLLDDNNYLNYSNEMLPNELEKVFGYWASNYSVTGFIVPYSEVSREPIILNVTESLNGGLKSDNIVVGTSSVSVDMVNLEVPGEFKEFVMEMHSDWHYYKFNPVGVANTANTQYRMNCVTLSLMLLPGTPLMTVTDMPATESAVGDMIRQCVELRESDSIKFGETQFANTTQNVVAYTRALKGTPGYAVAVNLGMGAGTNATETINFAELDYVPDSGTVVYSINGTIAPQTKVSLKDVKLAEHDGVVIQFVADY